MGIYVKKSIDVTYEDNSHGKSVTAVKTFEGEYMDKILEDIEAWRYENGYIIRSSLDFENFVHSRGDN